jgi:hypothetical protein
MCIDKMIMMRNYSLITIAVLSVLFACKGKQENHVSKSISEIVKDIAKTNILMGYAVGMGGERPEQWDRYEALCSGATDNELLALTNDTNSVVRCYAFQALAGKKTTDLFHVMLKHLADTAVVHQLYGCLGRSQKVGDFFLETVTDTSDNDRVWKLNVNQKAVIDSLLIFEKGNDLEARDRLLTEIEPEERYYKRLRKFITAQNNELLVVALSKYRKPQDKHLIEVLIRDPYRQTNGFTAVRNFPDRSFFPVLEETLKNEVRANNSGNDVRLQMLYEAIVQYKDKASRQLLMSVLSEAKNMQYIYHSDYLQMALKKYPATIYEGLVKPVFTGVPKK